MNINEFIYKLGVRIRNETINTTYKALKESESWSVEKLEDEQYKRCKSLLVYAYNNSDFYKKKFDELKVEPKDFIQLSDLCKFPSVSKQELLENIDTIQIKNKDLGKLFFSETSGSTGEPLVFYRSHEWDAGARAAAYRGYSWYGVNPWDRNGYFWGYNFNKKKKMVMRLLDILQNRFRIFSYNKNDIESFAKKLDKADFIEGYSSMIYEVAKVININGFKTNSNLKMVKGTSEKIYDKYQEEAKKAFGKKIISEYGAAEAGIIAFECPYGNMHITMEQVIVEEIENEILITNLLSKSFPVIRYKLGDYIKIDKTIKCKCGMRHYVVTDIMGRTGSVVKGNINTYPSLTFYYVFKNIALNYNMIINYQVIQKKIGEADLRVEGSLDEDKKSKLNKELCKYFSDDIKFNIIENGIERGNKKIRDFISLID